jgi:hypothetical protein
MPEGITRRRKFCGDTCRIADYREKLVTELA